MVSFWREWPCSCACTSVQRNIVQRCAEVPKLDISATRLCREAFNPEALYHAYERRTEHIKPSQAEYEAQRDADADFYRTADSLAFGGEGKVSDIGVERMVAELTDR